MSTLSFGPEPKTTGERQRKFKEKQSMIGGRTATAYLDQETAVMLDDLVKSRGQRKGGGKSGVIKEAIRHLHKVIDINNVASLAEGPQSETTREKLLALRRKNVLNRKQKII